MNAAEKTQAIRGALEAVDRILNRGGEADDVLREVVAAIDGRIDGYSFVGISFVEGDELALGPCRGEPSPAASVFPISFRGSKVAELAVAASALGGDDRAFLERVALLVSPYCLVGWDTGGVPWSELS